MGDVYRASPAPAVVSVDVLANIANCTPVFMGAFSGGEIRVPLGSAYTTLTPYTSGTPDGTFQEHLDEDGGSQAQTITAGKNMPARGSLFSSKWVKWVADAAGTFDLDLKG